MKEEYSGNVKVRVPKSLHKDLAIQAEKEDISLNQYCLYLLSKNNEIKKNDETKIIKTYGPEESKLHPISKLTEKKY